MNTIFIVLTVILIALNSVALVILPIIFMTSNIGKLYDMLTIFGKIVVIIFAIISLPSIIVLLIFYSTGLFLAKTMFK